MADRLVRSRALRFAAGTSKTIGFTEGTALDSTHLLVLRVQLGSATSFAASVTGQGWTEVTGGGNNGANQVRTFVRQGNGSVNSITFTTASAEGTAYLEAYKGFVSLTPIEAWGANGTSLQASVFYDNNGTAGYGVMLGSTGLLTAPTSWSGLDDGNGWWTAPPASARMAVTRSEYNAGAYTRAAWAGARNTREHTVIMPLAAPTGIPLLVGALTGERLGNGNITITPPAGAAGYLALSLMPDGDPTYTPGAGWTPVAGFEKATGGGMLAWIGSAGASDTWVVSGSAGAIDPHIIGVIGFNTPIAVAQGSKGTATLAPSLTAAAASTIIQWLVGANSVDQPAVSSVGTTNDLFEEAAWSAAGGYSALLTANYGYLEAAGATGTQAFTVPSAFGSDSATFVITAVTEPTGVGYRIGTGTANFTVDLKPTTGGYLAFVTDTDSTHVAPSGWTLLEVSPITGDDDNNYVYWGTAAAGKVWSHTGGVTAGAGIVVATIPVDSGLVVEDIVWPSAHTVVSPAATATGVGYAVRAIVDYPDDPQTYSYPASATLRRAGVIADVVVEGWGILGAVAMEAVTPGAVAAATWVVNNAYEPTAITVILGPGAGPTLVWSSEFNGTAGTQDGLAAQWEFEVTDDPPNGEYQAYTSRIDNITQTGTALALTARRETYGTKAWTSGRIRSLFTFVPNGGTTIVEMRVKVPVGKALWSAGWMIGPYESEDWPACGEMDLLEIMNNTLDVFMDLHGATNDGSGEGHWHDQTMWYAGGAPFADDFHVFRLEWSTTQIVWKVDGVARKTFTRAGMPANRNWEFDSPFSIILNLAVGGDWPGAPDGTTPNVSQMLVDYVRVYDATVAPREGGVPAGGAAAAYAYGPAAATGARASSGAAAAGGIAWGAATASGSTTKSGAASGTYGWGPAAAEGESPAGGGATSTWGWGPATAVGSAESEGTASSSYSWGPATAIGSSKPSGVASAGYGWGPATAIGERDSAGAASAAWSLGPATASGDVDSGGEAAAALHWGPATAAGGDSAGGSASSAYGWGPATARGTSEREGGAEATWGFGPAAASGTSKPRGGAEAAYGWGPAEAGAGTAPAAGSAEAALQWGPATAGGSSARRGGATSTFGWGPAIAGGTRTASGEASATYGWGPARAGGSETEFCWPLIVDLEVEDLPCVTLSATLPVLLLEVEDPC